MRQKDAREAKGGDYRAVVGRALGCGADTWSTTRSQENRLEVNEVRMLRWMSGVMK